MFWISTREVIWFSLYFRTHFYVINRYYSVVLFSEGTLFIEDTNYYFYGYLIYSNTYKTLLDTKRFFF